MIENWENLPANNFRISKNLKNNETARLAVFKPSINFYENTCDGAEFEDGLISTYILMISAGER